MSIFIYWSLFFAFIAPEFPLLLCSCDIRWGCGEVEETSMLVPFFLKTLIFEMTELLAKWIKKTGSVVFEVWRKRRPPSDLSAFPHLRVQSETQTRAANSDIPSASVSLDLFLISCFFSPQTTAWILRKASHLAGSGRCDISHCYTSSFISPLSTWAERFSIIRAFLCSTVFLNLSFWWLFKI